MEKTKQVTELLTGITVEDQLRNQLLEIPCMIFPCNEVESGISKNFLDEQAGTKGGCAPCRAGRSAEAAVNRSAVVNVTQNKESAVSKDAGEFRDRLFRFGHQRKDTLAQYPVTATIGQGKRFTTCFREGNCFRAFVVSEELPGKVEPHGFELIAFPKVRNGSAGTAPHIDDAGSGDESAPGKASIRE